MFHKRLVYHVHSRACDVRSIGFGCERLLKRCFRGYARHGKSPCFSGLRVLTLLRVDETVLKRFMVME